MLQSETGFAQAGEDDAAAPEPSTTRYGDWTVRCRAREAAPPCDMLQVATHQETGKPAMRFSIAHAGVRDRYGVQVAVPPGVLVSGGVLVRVDRRTDIEDLAFTRCESSGCFIEALLEPHRLAPFRRGAEGVLAFMDSSGEPVVLPLSFDGFTAADDAMSARNRAWAQNSNDGERVER